MKIACPLCQRDSPLLFRTKDYNRRLSQETFNYYRCPACRLIFLAPLPANLGDYYPANYYNMPGSLAELASGAEGQRYKMEIVQKFVSSGRLLEIGPGCGDFAYLAQQAGFEVDTIEMDERCCRFLQDVVGVRALNSDDVPAALANGATNNKSYNAVALWHVIEHLPDPWRTLEAIAARLAPGGIVVIAAPNPAAFQFRVLRRYWPHADAPRHVLLIPIPLLIRQAQKLGLKAVLVTTTDAGSLGWNTFGWQHFLSNLCTHPRLKSRAPRIGSIIARLLSPVERRGLRGSTYTIVLQKGQGI